MDVQCEFSEENQEHKIVSITWTITTATYVNPNKSVSEYSKGYELLDYGQWIGHAE